MKVKLGELTKIRTGKLDANSASENGIYPFFSCSKEPLRISTYSYDCECVLVAGNGDLNVKYYNGKFDAYQRTYIIESNGDGRLHLPYLYLFMTRYIQELRKLSIGGVIKYIKLDNLTDAEISLPSVKEQKDVCEKLKKVKNIIDKKETQISYLDSLIKARFVEMFNSETKRGSLQNLSIGKSGYGAASASVSYNPNRPRYIRITDINDDGTLNDDCVCSINKSDDEVFRLQKGDFLFARMGATVGKTYYYREGNQIFAGYLIRFKLDPEKILPEYLYAYTKTEEYLDWVKLNQSGAAQPGINAQKYSSLQIPIADIVEQTEFVYFVKQIDKSKFAVQKSLEKTQLLFDSLMQEYFG